MSACRLHRRSIVGTQADRLLIPDMEKNMLSSSLVVFGMAMALASSVRARTPDLAPPKKPASPEALEQSTALQLTSNTPLPGGDAGGK